MSLQPVAADRGDIRPVAAPVSRSGLVAVLLAVAAIVLAVAPLAVVTMPPLFDYPNHLARVDILARLADDTFLAGHYRQSSFILPNVLSDVVLLGLGRLVDADTAGRILLAATVALTAGGIAVLARVASGRASVLALMAGILATNEMMFWGFLNYDLGVALIPWAVALWLRLDGAPGLARVAAGAVFALVIAAAHLVAFGLYAVIIAILELDRAWRHRREPNRAWFGRLVASASQFVPVLALYVAISPSSRLAVDLQFDFSFPAKLMPYARLISSGNPWLDTSLLIGMVLLAVGLIVARRARVLRSLGLVTLGLAVLALALPYSALGSFFLDARVAIVVVLFAVAALVTTARLSWRAEVLLAGIILAAIGLRSAVLISDWRAQESGLAELRAAFATLPRDSLVAAGSGRDFELGDWTTTRRVKPAYEHAAGYAVIDRHAFVPNIFARAGQNPLVVTPGNQAEEWLAGNPIRRLYNEDDLFNFASDVAAARPITGGSGRAFAVAYFRKCGEWPARAQVRLVACGSDFSIVEVTDKTPPKQLPVDEDDE
jgi:uncharacterized membrane protein